MLDCHPNFGDALIAMIVTMAFQRTVARHVDRNVRNLTDPSHLGCRTANQAAGSNPLHRSGDQPPGFLDTLLGTTR